MSRHDQFLKFFGFQWFDFNPRKKPNMWCAVTSQWKSFYHSLPVWLSCSAPSFLPVSVASEHQGCCPAQTESASPVRKDTHRCCQSTGKTVLCLMYIHATADCTCSCSAVNDVRALLAGFGWQSWSEGRAPSRVNPVPFKIDAWWQEFTLVPSYEYKMTSVETVSP